MINENLRWSSFQQHGFLCFILGLAKLLLNFLIALNCLPLHLPGILSSPSSAPPPSTSTLNPPNNLLIGSVPNPPYVSTHPHLIPFNY